MTPLPAQQVPAPSRRALLSRLWARFSGVGGRNALLYAVTSVAAKGATLILAPIYTRQLSPSEYGDLALAQTLVGLLPTFVSLGLLAAVGRFFYEGATPAEGVQRAGGAARWLTLFALSSAVTLQFILVLLPLPTSGIFQFRELSCVVWGATGALMMGVPIVILRSSQRAAAASLLQIADLMITLSAAIILVAVMGRGVRGALEAVAISGIANLLICFVFVLRTMPGRLEVATLRRALVFSLPYVPHFLANQLLLVADRWILKTYGFETELGIYALASQMAAPVSLLILAWNEAISPKLGEEFRAGGLASLSTSRKSTVRGYLWVAVAGSATVLLVSPLVLLVFGASYRTAVWILPLLCVALTVESFYYPYSNFVFFANRSAVIPKITFISGFVNVMVNFALIPFLGVRGAIVSRLLAGGLRSLLLRAAANAALTGPFLPAPPLAAAPTAE